MKFKRGDLVEVAWKDHSTMDRWIPVDSMNTDLGLTNMRTAGYYIGEDKSCMRIVSTYTIDYDGCSSGWAIGKKDITKIKRLKKSAW